MLHLAQRKIFHVLLFLSLVVGTMGVAVAQDQPQPSITYRLSMPRPVSHLFEVKIEVELPKNASAESLDFQIPKWSPGRYAVFDFAKNVQELRAAAPGNCPRDTGCALVVTLPVTRV